jgi:3',5'-cyclic-AMP phosphodiesterase
MNLSRRDLMLGTSMLALGSSAGFAGKQEKKRALRVAHLTDIHILPNETARTGTAGAFRSVYELKDRPDLIINGGDTIFDAFAAKRERTREQWAVWDGVLKDFNEIPIRHCIGNHDLWGWAKSAEAPEDDPLYGKLWAQERFQMAERFESFDLGGWRFITLDSTHRKGESYEAKLDELQFEWLKAELERTPHDMPVLLTSHIPILCANGFLDGDLAKTGDWVVPGSYMHLDAKRLKELFLKHPNVKVALSGHMHQIERLDYCGVAYLCGGAVSGSWWNGPYLGSDPGYMLVDLYPDGSYAHQFVVCDYKKL